MIERVRRIRVEAFAELFRRSCSIVHRSTPPDEILLRELREVFEALDGEDVDAVGADRRRKGVRGGNDLHEFAVRTPTRRTGSMTTCAGPSGRCTTARFPWRGP